MGGDYGQLVRTQWQHNRNRLSGHLLLWVRQVFRQQPKSGRKSGQWSFTCGLRTKQSLTTIIPRFGRWLFSLYVKYTAVNCGRCLVHGGQGSKVKYWRRRKSSAHNVHCCGYGRWTEKPSFNGDDETTRMPKRWIRAFGVPLLEATRDVGIETVHGHTKSERSL